MERHCVRAKRKVGEEMIVCGRAARWRDSEIQEMIKCRRELHKRTIHGRRNL